MNEEILVTIVTPSFNQGQFIEETILSVLNQTYPNIQYIIVDGGSTDNTMDIIEKYRDKIDIVIHEKDNGQSDAINKGFKLAKGSLVGWINSDDILYKDCVSRIVELYKQRNDGSIYYGSKLDFIDTDGKVFWTNQIDTIDREYLLRKNYSLIQQGSFYNNKVLKEVGYLDSSIHYCMDLDLWLKLSAKAPIYRLKDKPVAAFRIWEETKTSTGNDKFLRDISKILKRHGSSIFDQNQIRLRKYIFKTKLKRLLRL